MKQFDLRETFLINTFLFSLITVAYNLKMFTWNSPNFMYIITFKVIFFSSVSLSLFLSIYPCLRLSLSLSYSVFYISLDLSLFSLSPLLLSVLSLFPLLSLFSLSPLSSLSCQYAN